jgi:predicted CopG family antitoxin
MKSTIQIREDLLKALKKRKLHPKESYEDVIWDLLEDQMVLKEEIINQIEIGRKEYLEGKFQTMDDVFGSKDKTK